MTRAKLHAFMAGALLVCAIHAAAAGHLFLAIWDVTFMVFSLHYARKQE